MALLLEREAELSAVAEALGRARGGQGSVLVVTAPPGAGKTSLLRAIRSTAADLGVRALTARGSDLERDFAFGVVRQLFDSVLLPEPDAHGVDLLEGVAAPAAAVFDPTVTVGRGAASAVFPPLSALFRLLSRLSGIGPIALLIDDVQWVDEASLQFLGFVARRIDDVPVALVLAARPVETGAEDTPLALLDVLLASPPEHRVTLRPLSASAVAALVRDRLGHDADDEFCSAVVDATGGNPLFLQELMRVWVAEARAPTAAFVSAIGEAGPNAIGAYTDVRLRRHPPGVRRLAQAVAVLGDGCDPTLAVRLADVDADDAVRHARTLVTEGILDPGQLSVFSHPLLREAVLRGVRQERRLAMHRRAADLLIDDGAPPERVALHLLLAPPSDDPRHLDVLAAAAGEMRRRGAPQAALVYLRRAVQQDAVPSVRAEFLRVLGRAEAYCLHLTEAMTSLEAALRLAVGAEHRALCAFSLARLQHATGRVDDAVETLLATTAELASSGKSPGFGLRLEIEMIGVARVSLHRRQLIADRFPSLLARREEACRTWPAAGDVLDAQRSWDQMRSGEPVRVAAATAEAALADGLLLTDLVALSQAVHSLLVADEVTAAERYLERALRLATDRGLALPAALIHGYLARAAFQRGDVDAAAHHVDTALTAADGVHATLPLSQTTQVHVLIERARLKQAESVIERSVLADGSTPHAGVELQLLDARCRLRSVQGRWAHALDDALLLGQLYKAWGAEKFLDLPWRIRAATAMAQLGDMSGAHSLIDDQLRLAQAAGATRAFGVALRTAATLRTSTEALTLASDAVEVLEGVPARLELARALQVLGTLQLDEGDDRRGRASLRRALDLADECSATGLVSRLTASAPGLGNRRPRTNLSGVLALTAAEGRVARLAADGLSNRRIARELYITDKTVEAHLSRIYRKLAIGGREDLTTALRDAFGSEPPAPS